MKIFVLFLHLNPAPINIKILAKAKPLTYKSILLILLYLRSLLVLGRVQSKFKGCL